MKQSINRPIISMVLPVYNGEKFLELALISILKQSFKEFELIVIDDCSRDSTPEIIKKYLTKDKRIHYFRNKKNLKLPGSLAAGFKKAKGKYYTWTSDDNILHEDCLKTLLGVIRETGVDVVYSDFKRIDENGKLIDVAKMDKAEKLVCGQGIGACFLYTREVDEAIGGYDVNTFVYEDYDFWVRAYLKGFKFKKIDNLMYDYRIHGNSLSSMYKVVDGWIIYRYNKLNYYKNVEEQLMYQARIGLLMYPKILGVKRSFKLLGQIILKDAAYLFADIVNKLK